MTDVPPAASWRYAHLDLGEHPLPDGSPIRRPAVVVATASVRRDWIAVVDSGSPISVADPAVLEAAGVDLTSTPPVMELPLGMGSSFRRVNLYDVELALVPPAGVDEPPRRWRLDVAAQPGWRLPFGLLLGQRGWFDRFPTAIDGTSTTVHLPPEGRYA